MIVSVSVQVLWPMPGHGQSIAEVGGDFTEYVREPLELAGLAADCKVNGRDGRTEAAVGSRPNDRALQAVRARFRDSCRSVTRR